MSARLFPGYLAPIVLLIGVSTTLFLVDREAAGGEAADVDFLFDIPVVLVQRFTGYKHDDVSSAEDQFEVLESTEQSGKSATSWVGRLFGGRDK